MIDQRIVTRQHLHPGILGIQRRKVRIIVPQIRKRRPNIRHKLLGIGLVQLPHRRRQHHHITRRKCVLQNDLSWLVLSHHQSSLRFFNLPGNTIRFSLANPEGSFRIRASDNFRILRKATHFARSLVLDEMPPPS